MPAEIINGKKISNEIKSELKTEIKKLKKRDVVPGLAAVLVGDNPASVLYVKMKARASGSIPRLSNLMIPPPINKWSIWLMN